MEDKKFFDIFPPGVEKHPRFSKEIPEEELIETEREESVEEPREEKPAVQKKPLREILSRRKPAAGTVKEVPAGLKKPNKRLIFLGVFLAILLAGSVFFYLRFPRVSIEVWLKTEPLSFDEKAQVTKEVKELSAADRMLPGRVIVEEQSLSQDFPATGKESREEKAEGIVRIFNGYSTSSQILVADTRLVSSEGKLFRLVSRTLVPGGVKDSQGKLISGSIETKVRADAAGPEYNIGSSTFSVPGFAGTPKYTAFYAESSSTMKGGFRGETTVVTSADLENARKVTEARIESKINEALRNRTLSGLIMVGGRALAVSSSVPSAKAGEAVKTFTHQVKAKKEAVLLAGDDLNRLAEGYFASRLEGNKLLWNESLKIESRVEAADSQTGQATLSLHVSGKAYEALDQSSLERQLLGKSLSEVQLNFQSLSQVARARIKIFPSFFNRIPDDGKKVELKFDFE